MNAKDSLIFEVYVQQLKYIITLSAYIKMYSIYYIDVRKKKKNEKKIIRIE